MSFSTINEILGLAVIDETFQHALLTDPLAAVRRRHFVLSVREEEILCSIHTTDFVEFVRLLREQLATNDRPGGRRCEGYEGCKGAIPTTNEEERSDEQGR
jgi:hypothetical protein